MVRVPKYRSDAKGNVKALVAECADLMRGEIANGDFFAITFEDLEMSCQEYRDILTDAELERAFRAALARPR